MLAPRSKAFEKYYISQVSEVSKSEFIEKYIKDNKTDWELN